MNKGLRITLICIISLLILLVIGGTIFGYVQKYAYADYNSDILGNSEAIVNFNQLFNYNSVVSNENYNRVNNKFKVLSSNNFEIDLGISADFVTGNKYFIYVNSTGSYLGVEIYRSGVTSVSFYATSIYNSTVTNNLKFYLRSLNNNLNATVSIYCIDLTSMFGIGNEPNIQQCNELFVAEYYPYNTGTPMYNDTLQAYTNGVNAYLSTTELTMNTGDFIGSCYAVNLNNEYIGYGNYTDETTSLNWSVLTKNNNSVTLSSVPTSVNSEAMSTICLPFYATLKAGTQITITGYIYDGAYNQVHNVGVGYWVANNMVEIGNMTGYSGSPVRYKENILTYTLPVDIDRIYIYCGLDGQTINLQNFSVAYYLTDIEALKSASSKYGYEQAKSYYETYYGVDGDGYKEIYNIGKQYGLQHNDNNAWGSAWDFIQSAFTGIGSIFTIELLPNVPLSVFVLVPLMVGLIFFIIKVVKGGGS